MVMIYSLLGHRAACWAGINQRVLHHWVRGLPAQDPAVGAPTYQLQKAGVVLVISESPHPSSAILGCHLCWPLLGSVHSRLIFTWISQP